MDEKNNGRPAGIKAYAVHEAVSLARHALSGRLADMRSFARSNRSAATVHPEGSGPRLELEREADAYDANAEVFTKAIELVENAEAAEAEAALLRQAAEDVCKHWSGPFEASGFAPYACHPQCVWCNDPDPDAPGVQRHLSAKALRSAITTATAGQSLLDHIKTLEEQNRLLSVLSAGCNAHRGYRPEDGPPFDFCDQCKGIWQARQALDKLKEGNGK